MAHMVCENNKDCVGGIMLTPRGYFIDSCDLINTKTIVGGRRLEWLIFQKNVMYAARWQ